MDRDFKKAVKRVLLLDTLLNVACSVSNTIDDVGDGLEELFGTTCCSKRVVKDFLINWTKDETQC